ncbi:MFS transporter [Demequina aurantiaca]|uniref:MFS transporter n=1 Tax=Demequina aurantiaca TaxID=676200 RepID=UPI000784A53A|nr:MFS transporter [Demequina aurantiaca]
MTATAPAPKVPNRTGKEWLQDWDPEGPNWDKKLAWRTLWITTFNLTLCFIAWFLVSAIAPVLNDLGFDLTQSQLYWLTAMPGLAGGFLRLVWMFLPPVLGTRKMVTFTTILLLVPFIGWAIAVQNPDTPYFALILLALFAGIGGGAFSGFMPSTSYFFPKKKAGTALGVQAGVGNFGVSVVQIATPWIVGIMLLGGAFATQIGGSQQLTDAATGATREVWYQNAGYAWVPLTIIGAIAAWFMLKSIPMQVRGVKDQLDIFKNKHTWNMTVLYVVTFGAFSGFAAVFGLLIDNIYGTGVFGDDGINPLQYAFLGALVGSAARVLAGPVSDKLGGAPVTLVSCLGTGAACVFTAFQLNPTSASDFPMFLWGMLAIFFFSGIGNASTFKQMPSIFHPRQAGGVIGFTAAIAAFGPFFFSIILASSASITLYIYWAVISFIGVGITWWFYARKGAEMPS